MHAAAPHGTYCERAGETPLHDQACRKVCVLQGEYRAVTRASGAIHMMPPTRRGDAARRYGNQALRFVARFAHAPGYDAVGPADAERAFIVSFFLATDELLVYEPPIRNSGISGGKFFERAKAFKPGTRTYYGASDFHVGARIPLVSRCGTTSARREAVQSPVELLRCGQLEWPCTFGARACWCDMDRK